MSEDRKVTLLKSGNRLIVKPTTPSIKKLLQPALTYTSKRFLYGYERKQSGNKVEFTDYKIYTYDHLDRLVTSFGFHSRISEILRKAGWTVGFKDLQPNPKPERLEPMWERLGDPQFKIDLRPGQDEFLIKMMSSPCGRFDCPPGFGKSWIIGVVGLLLPKARIDVVSKRVPVLRDRIYPELCQILPSVGIVGGGKSVRGKRVMCYTADSLQHSDGQADVLIGDEVHELAADRAAAALAVYDRSRNYGLSASQDMRLDGKDLRVEAIFGPVIYKMDYSQAQHNEMVVPIRVEWSNVKMDFNPCGDADEPVERKRYGIWRNDVRNQIIADDAMRYDQDTQVLITCETIEHMCHLKKLLPDFQLVYAENGMSAEDRHRYIRKGLLTEDEPTMSFERRRELTRDFELGRLKKAICNTVWNVGVNFRQLAVLIRADAGGSPINDIQIPGRASRVIEGKTHATIHDYVDQFDKGFKQKATRRSQTYTKQGWLQTFPDKNNSMERSPAEDLWSGTP